MTAFKISKPLVKRSVIDQEIDATITGSEKSADSPAFRAELLAYFKTLYKNCLKQAETLLFEDGDGTKCAKRLSHLQDTLIQVLYDFACDHVYRSENRSSGERITIAAVGGYGRGTLAPGSDIDLLFLLPYKQTAWGEQILEFILYFLWDMGFKVGHSVRNVNECMRQSKADITIRTAILEARYIDGDRTLFDELRQRFNKEIVAKTAKEFIDAKLEERDQRHKKAGESRYLVEPNVKDGKGGLRDLHTLFWIGKYYYQVERQRDLVDAGLFTADEFKRFKRAERFLWTVRCHMHFLTVRAEERFSFDIQREMAERLKYASHGGLQDVERFMKHYFLVAKDVGDLTLIACQQLEEEQAKSVVGINGLIQSIRFQRRRLSGTTDFMDDHGRINMVDETVFKRDPVNLLRLYKLADDNNLDIHPDTVAAVSRSLKFVDKKLRENEEANRIFLSILTSRNQPEILLRKMNETGLLGKFIPAFGRIVAMMQFNMYHHYTVDEHLIRTVGVLARIENGAIAPDHPLASRLLPEVNDRELLYTALLIHDIAKGRKEDHSTGGAKVARKLCPRLGFSKARTETIAWLIEEHLTMSLTAQARDLTDRKTIETFAKTVQSIERLRYLLILTVCDIRAVGPGVWNGWKGQLLRTLYYEAEPLLRGGFSTLNQRARVGQAKTVLAQSLSDWEAKERERIIALPSDAYFLSTPLEHQIRHFDFIRKAENAGDRLALDIDVRDFEGVTEITVLSPDHPKLLSIIAGACSAADANIVDAKIHTTNDGRALDSIFITRKYDFDDDERRRGQHVCNMIRDALIGKTRLPDLLKRNSGYKKSQKAFEVPAKIHVTNDVSNDYTVIEVECLDRPGVLAEIAFVLAELNLNIGSAQIATFGEKVIDTFYVTDLLGDKIVLESRINKIANSLTEALKTGTAMPVSGKVDA